MITVFQAKNVFASFETKKNIHIIVVSDFWKYVKPSQLMLHLKNSETPIGFSRENIFKIDIWTTLS